MSFQAYLDNIEKQTGKTPNGFIALAAATAATHCDSTTSSAADARA